MTYTIRKDAEAIERLINGMANEEYVAKELALISHRTLQQKFMRLCIAFIKAEANNSYDLRNQATVELARQIISAMEEFDFKDTALPFI